MVEKGTEGECQSDSRRRKSGKTVAVQMGGREEGRTGGWGGGLKWRCRGGISLPIFSEFFCKRVPYKLDSFSKDHETSNSVSLPFIVNLLEAAYVCRSVSACNLTVGIT